MGGKRTLAEYDGPMLETAEVMGDIQRRYACDWKAQAPVQKDIARWTEGVEAAETALYDSLAAELARGYSERRFSFDFCDVVVNQLYGVMISKQLRERPPQWPKVFWRVFEAFDAGEFYRSADRSDNPVADFTDPEIAEIIRDLDGPKWPQ